MNGKLNNSLITNTSLYVFSNILIALIPLAFLPVLTRFLSPSDYGLVSLYQVVVVFLGAIFGFSVNGFCNIKFFEVDGETKRIGEYVTGSIYLLLFITLFISVCFLFIYLYQDYLYGVRTNVLFLLSVAFFSQYVIYIRLGLYQVKNQSVFYCGLNILNALLNILLTISFVIVLEYGYLGRLLGIVLSLLFIAIFSIYSLYRANFLFYSVTKKVLLEIINYGFSYAPNVIFVSLIPLLQRTLIAYFLGASSVGIFMVANQISNGFLLVSSSFITAYTPVVYKRLADNNFATDGILIKECTFFIFYVLFGSLILFTGLLDYFLTYLLPSNYFDAIPLAKLLVMSTLLKGGVMLISIYPMYLKLNLSLSVITAIFGFFELTLIYLFITNYGLISLGYVAIFIKLCTFLFLVIFTFKVLKDLSAKSQVRQ